MKADKITNDGIVWVMGGGVLTLPAASGDVLRVRYVNGSVVVDRMLEDDYNRRYGTAGVGGSEIPATINP